MTVTLVLAVAGWLLAVASMAGLSWLIRERRAYQRELPAVRTLRGELEAAGRWEHALRADNLALQKRLDDAEDEVRHYREAAKVQNIHNAALEAKEQKP